MKRLCILLSLLLLLGCLTGCAQKTDPPETAAPETKAPETQPPATKAPETEAPAPEVELLPDFTVKTIDGAGFTLSEALKDHELVLINLFATWCGPCEMEFPYLQEAWQQTADKVAVIALSVEPTDTDEVLTDYAAERGLTLPMGSATGTELGSFVTEGIPTTILVDRTGRVAGVEVGAKTATEAFLSLFDGFTGEDYDPNVCTYTVYAYDTSYEGVAGAVFNFCTDTMCTPVTTDADGAAVFTGPPARYHVQVVSAPNRLTPMSGDEFTTEPYAQTFYIPFSESGT